VTGQRKLFTVIMEFEGTTSESQVRARSANEALKFWARKLRTPDVYALKKKQAAKLIRGFKSDNDLGLLFPVALNGVGNVWCTTVSGGRSSALINIVATLEESN